MAWRGLGPCVWLIALLPSVAHHALGAPAPLLVSLKFLLSSRYPPSQVVEGPLRWAENEIYRYMIHCQCHFGCVCDLLEECKGLPIPRC
ncbi:hypothetical protein FIBSPDRAFT_877724 [Athelia psychrophila]|uniref:Uncharacterized protein n=1 Tax=Athelia psychrophila TaxID=1759441 RepID=A0A167VR67_9AGAM|nr:hypothetical protein FIBSPDRAFT_877724 [Fibularhizoctonia sp. CBS 109695]